MISVRRAASTLASDHSMLASLTTLPLGLPPIRLPHKIAFALLPGNL